MLSNHDLTLTLIFSKKREVKVCISGSVVKLQIIARILQETELPQKSCVLVHKDKMGKTITESLAVS